MLHGDLKCVLYTFFFAPKLTISDNPKFLDLTFGRLNVNLTLPMLIIASYLPIQLTFFEKRLSQHPEKN